MEIDYLDMTSMASKEENTVFHFREFNGSFDQVLHTYILLLRICLGSRWQSLRSVEPKL